MPITGRVTFDYSSANGIYVIGNGDALFETNWSRGGSNSLYILRDPPSIDAVALAEGATEISQIRDAARFDYSSRSRHPKRGEIVLLRNNHGLYAALKIIGVKSAGHSDAVDEVSFEYIILDGGGRSFSVIPTIDIGTTSFPHRVLLVGAGFSRNWGGLLANEVKEYIFRHSAVQSRPALRELVLTEPSFEDALEKARTGLFESEDEIAMEVAIKAAFDQMDADFRNPNAPVLGATINNFIGRFCPGAVGVGTGYVFSLNQDLLLERIYGTQVDKQQLTIPGVTWLDRPPPFPAGMEHIPLASVEELKDGNEAVLQKNFNLIKLHGSINWRSSAGSPSIVMGRRKTLTISKSPLLVWYHRVFERVLSSGNVRLMVIGYGWGDEHINEAIAIAVRNHGLKIYDWNPSPPEKTLKNIPQGGEILSGLIGFITRSMTEVMPPNPTNPGSASYDSIVKDFF